MKAKDVETLAAREITRWIPEWRMVWDTRRGRNGKIFVAAGRCDYRRKEIRLNLFLSIIAAEAEVRETILHEIGHALTPMAAPAHGDEWRKNALMVGASGKRCYTRDPYIVAAREIEE